MATQHLDLEEQEQLEQLKHFWQRYGNLITWALIAVLALLAGWNGWQYWQRTQAARAAALQDEVERTAAGTDLTLLERALQQMEDRFGGTVQASQSALMAAKVFDGRGRVDAAKRALTWVAEHSPDAGYQTVARLRLAGLLADAKAYDEAMRQLSGTGLAPEFAPLAADRRGDLFRLQGKKTEAVAEYRKAWQGLDERSSYRRLVEVKLDSLGAAPRAPAAGVAP